MSLKRILGTMLASRMAGRGRRRGMGAAGMLGGHGYRRRSGMGGKLGLAAMGYMAYKAYQDSQAKSGGASRPSSTSSSSGGIAGMVQDVVNQVTGKTSSGEEPSEAELRQDAQAAEQMNDGTALLLIRAMITAAYADGSLSMDERQKIMGEIEEAGGTSEDRAVMEREIANPKPLDQLLTEVNDEETAEEFYLASSAAVDSGTEANRAYLSDLRRRLNISEEKAAEIDEVAA